jgi:predicted nucleic acid-binding protein
MGPITSLTDPAAILAADTSTIINLNATGCASQILRFIPNRLVVTDVVLSELEEGRRRGRSDADALQKLVKASLVKIVTLDLEASPHFEQLVIGPAAMTVDDGEAATIAYAIGRAAVAVIDERKATRLCAELFPSVRTACTVDILAHPQVQDGLGKHMLADAIFKALRVGRMRVFHQHLAWVIGLIGPDQAALCISLPSSVRQSPGYPPERSPE